MFGCGHILDGSVISFDVLLDLGGLRIIIMFFVMSFGVKVCDSVGSKGCEKRWQFLLMGGDS